MLSVFVLNNERIDRTQGRGLFQASLFDVGRFVLEVDDVVLSNHVDFGRNVRAVARSNTKGAINADRLAADFSFAGVSHASKVGIGIARSKLIFRLSATDGVHGRSLPGARFDEGVFLHSRGA